MLERFPPEAVKNLSIHIYLHCTPSHSRPLQPVCIMILFSSSTTRLGTARRRDCRKMGLQEEGIARRRDYKKTGCR